MHRYIRHICLAPDEKPIDDLGLLNGRLQPGLTGTAAAVIEEKTLLQYFFRNLKRQYRRFLEGGI